MLERFGLPRPLGALGLGALVGALVAVSGPGCHRSDTTAPATANPSTANPSTATSQASDGARDPAMQLRDALTIGNWQVAWDHAQSALLKYPNNPNVITDAARAAAKTDRRREAAKLLVDAAEIANYEPSSRVDFAVQALIDVGEIYEAIDLLERTVAAHPQSNKHRRMLIGFLGEAERTELIEPHYQKLILDRAFDFPVLVAFTESSTRRLSADTIDVMMERNPSDHRVRLGKARFLIDFRDAAKSRGELEEILEHHPSFAPAHALLGQVLVSEQKFDQLEAWHQRVPDEAQQYVEYWLTLGDWASDRGQQVSAARAYWEATRRNPNDVAAWTRLAHAIRFLRSSGSDAAEAVSDQQLADIDLRVAGLMEARKQLFNFMKTDQTSQRCAVDTAKALADAGRYWEAEAWTAAATKLTDDLVDDLESTRNAIIAKLRQKPSWLAEKEHPSLTMDLSSLPSPLDISDATEVRRITVTPAIVSTDHLRLAEVADDWGLAGVGADNCPENPRLGPLIRSTGIGGGAIDYDLDGRADLLVMGAGGTMQKSDSFPNDLFRNVDSQFVRVTDHAAVGDRGFGQGVGVGDYNEDGFPDLFFANLGKNRLLRNNGDGTFTDCTHLLRDGGSQAWTTCGAFIDVDQDGITDLITTNYVETVPNLDRACPREDGTPGPCHPLKFPAFGDQFFVGTPESEFQDVTDAWSSVVSPGRGLGILAGTLSEGEFGLLIANDMTENEFYTRASDGSMRLVESAAARGVAVDARTLPQASMGIASGDFDGDGDLDIYVTGFGKEYNIYYEQVTDGLWKDETGKFGLIEPTLNTVGFGTEAIDLDDDGIDEFAVTNGHVGDFEDDEVEFEQPFQLLRRDDSGKFQVVQDDGWGQYFSSLHVGRTLWTMDVDEDGRNDVFITHMNEQIRLLVNRSEDTNHRIAFKLVGRDCSRDAAGAIVRFQADGRIRTLWCLAGHGYLCTNEQVLRAGLGQASQVENVTVTWQDGSVDEIGTLDANNEYLIVQGDDAAFPVNP